MWNKLLLKLRVLLKLAQQLEMQTSDGWEMFRMSGWYFAIRNTTGHLNQCQSSVPAEFKFHTLLTGVHDPSSTLSPFGSRVEQLEWQLH